MSATYLYPGSFCPPTYGHLATLTKAVSICDHVGVVCSRNPDKTNYWFTEEECQNLWSAYKLPQNISVGTFGKSRHDRSSIVIIRGLRHGDDIRDEAKVIATDYRDFGIDKYLHLVAGEEYCAISSSRARDAAARIDLRALATMVAPLVVTALLEKVLRIRNLFMVTGRPGGGKSTFCRMMTGVNPRIVHINTDDFNHQLRPILERAFPGGDLINLALHNEAELIRVIGGSWVSLAEAALRQASNAEHVLVEAAMGMKESQRLYRYFGGKILCVDTTDQQINLDRIHRRGSPQYAPFLAQIPDCSVTSEIAQRERLSLTFVDSSGDLTNLQCQAENLNIQLEKGAKPWTACLPGRYLVI